MNNNIELLPVTLSIYNYAATLHELEVWHLIEVGV